MKSWFEKIPSWAIACVSLISEILTIVTSLSGIILWFLQKIELNYLCVFIITVLMLFNFQIMLKMRKFRKLSFERMEVVSLNYRRLTHKARDLYFGTMHSHKLNTQTLHSLTTSYHSELIFVLDYLCNIMKNYTGKEIKACIKLIMYNENDENDEIIDVNKTVLTTFCRSSNSEIDRGLYEDRLENQQIKLCDNTDFLDIIDNVNGSTIDYFYQGNLLEYDKVLKQQGKRYKNSNEKWSDFYIGTIVVPIQIKFSKLYHQKKDDSNHVIGFLCIDSDVADAFELKQEKFNVNVVKSFANIIYILLGQYRHYLKKLNNDSKS